MELDCENKICTGSKGGGPFHKVKLDVFAVFQFKRQFTAFRGVLEGFVRSLTPPKIEFYILGGVAGQFEVVRVVQEHHLFRWFRGIYHVFKLKYHFTALGIVLEGFVRSLTPIKIQFYLLGGAARSI